MRMAEGQIRVLHGPTQYGVSTNGPVPVPHRFHGCCLWMRGKYWIREVCLGCPLCFTVISAEEQPTYGLGFKQARTAEHETPEQPINHKMAVGRLIIGVLLQ